MPTPAVDFSYTRQLRAAIPRKLSRVSDGDTPVIEQPIRMVSCDTPEKSGYAGKPEVSQPKLDACRERLADGYYDALPERLRNYLIRKLKPDAAERHIAPWFSGSAADPVPPREAAERRTFNLAMVENGWAAFFPVYPSLPQNTDFNLAIRAAETAWTERRGAWAGFGRDLLLAYEYRACIKLGTAKNVAAGSKAAFQRICVDLRDLKIKGLYGFHAVPPPYRLWVWQEDIGHATKDLGLTG